MTKNRSPVTRGPRQSHPNVVPLEGEIDLHLSPEITRSLEAMAEKRPERIVIDLSLATYIDSAGLAALIIAMQKTEAYGGKFFLAGVHETVLSVLESSRLDQIFQIFPDVDAALAANT